MSGQLFSDQNSINQFKSLVKKTTFKGNPLRIKYDKSGNEKLSLSNTYIKFVKNNRFAPLPTTLILNPETNRIVKKTSILTTKGKIKKQYSKDLGIFKGKVIAKKSLPQQVSKSKGVRKLVKSGVKELYKISLKSKIKDLEYGDELWVDMDKLDLEAFLPLLQFNKDYLVETENGKTIYGLGNNSKQDLQTLLKAIRGGQVVKMTDSKEEILHIQKTHQKFKLTLRKPKKDIFKKGVWKGEKKIKKTIKGEFWGYYNLTDYDLKRYGVFTEFKKDNYKNNCFIEALKHSDLDVSVLSNAEDKCFGKQMEVRKLNKVSTLLNITIKLKFLKTITDKKKEKEIVVSETKKYGNGNKTINIGLIDSHYFLIEDTPYKNTKGNNKDSWTVMKEIWDNKDTMMVEMPNGDKLKTIYANEVNDIEYPSLVYNDFLNEKIYEKTEDENGNTNNKCVGDNGGELKEWEVKNPKDKKYVNVFFDFESVPYDKHMAWCCVCLIDKKHYEPRRFFGEHCGKDMLDYVKKEFEGMGKTLPRLIAHNLNYDYNFIQEVKGLSHNIEAVIKDGKIYTASGFYFGMPLKFECSLQKMGMLIPLAKFKKNFGIKQDKDVCPYGIYTVNNIHRQYIPIAECQEHLKPSQHKDFIECAKRVDSLENDCVDIIKYGMEYCVKDVEVLQAGYNVYRDLVLKVNKNIDINNFLTLASMAQEHFVSTDCYEDVYKIGGIARNFLQNFVVGGRTMLCQNKVQTPKGIGAVWDARSLYPSAMYFMGANGKKGILKGKPKIIDDKNLNYEWLSNQDGYFVLAKVIKVGKELNFPILSYLDDKTGVRYFSNDMVGKYVFIDRFTLEDFKEFQNGDVEIIQGYYFDEGRNETICDEIHNVYETRKSKKKEGCSTQLIYKLFMNSAYGKTIMKASNTRTVYRAGEDVEDYISKNFDSLKRCDFNATKERARIEEWCSVSEHYSSPQVGSEILSYSKRIMNRLMTCADDIGVKIYYCDTDSIHLSYEDVAKVEAKYFELYGMELDGDALGNFHIDLESDIIEDRAKELKLKEGKDYYLVSQEALFLNKKDYCESMIGLITDEKGTIILNDKKFKLMCDKDGKEIIDYSIHIKGIPELAVWYKCNKEKMNPIEFFKKRYRYGVEDLRTSKSPTFGNVFDDEITIDCLKTWCREKNEEWVKCSFEFNKDHTISNRESLVRTVSIGQVC